MTPKPLIIVDAGSTNSTWIKLIEGAVASQYAANSMNPYVTSVDEMKQSILSVPDTILNVDENPKIFFYGAGCTEVETIHRVKEAFKKANVKSETVNISHDLLAAARALFQDESGIPCILGTGSSSALYVNGIIQDQIPSLGYVLGDYGGGADLGKRLLVSILKRDCPKEISTIFYESFGLSKKDILGKIYFEERPNKFLASFTPFIRKNIKHEFCRDLALSSFNDFISLDVLKYEGYQDLPISFIGSVAYYFQDLLKEVLNDYNLKFGAIYKSPIEGLIRYHSA